MARDPDPSTAQRPRPLPTVDVALLRHDVQAARARNIAVVTALLVAALIVVGFVFRAEVLHAFSSEESVPKADQQASPSDLPLAGTGDPVPEGHAAIVSSAAAPLAEQVRPGQFAVETNTPALVAPSEPASENSGPSGSVTVRFGKARGFRDALVRAGVGPDDANSLVTALDKLVDFRRCRPEHELTLVRDEQGVLQRFDYRASRTDLYRASRDGALFAGEKVEIPIETRRVAKGGHVRDSLGKALEHLGLGTGLVGAFVEAFERQISFKKDTREGDAFRMIVDEQYIDGEFLGYGTVHAVSYVGERAGQLTGYWYEVRGEAGDFFDSSGRAMNGGWLRTPLRYDHISSRFDPKRRHPVLKRIMPHNGLDYAASTGTPIWAAASGTVTFAGFKGPNGNLIALRHDDGYESFYAHLSRINKGIKRGARVSQRQVIGAVGTTGRSTGPHLHFGLKHRGRFLDPLTQLNGPGKPLPGRDAATFKRLRAALDKELATIVLAPAPPESDDHAESSPGENFEEGEDL